MNKNDLKLILIIIGISLIMLSFLYFSKDNESKIANVYYDNDLVLSIDLNEGTEKTYEVVGYNGKVIIKTSNGKIKVDEENSPLHLCSKQGYIEKSYETIICLPNKIVIEIENNELDTVVR